MGTETPPEQAQQLRVAATPAILHVQVDDGPIQAGEADLEDRPVLILALVHDEDPVRPQKQVTGGRHGGKGRHAGRADLVPGIVGIQVLRCSAAVDVGGADEQDALAGRYSLLCADCTRSRWYTQPGTAVE